MNNSDCFWWQEAILAEAIIFWHCEVTLQFQGLHDDELAIHTRVSVRSRYHNFTHHVIMHVLTFFLQQRCIMDCEWIDAQIHGWHDAWMTAWITAWMTWCMHAYVNALIESLHSPCTVAKMCAWFCLCCCCCFGSSFACVMLALPCAIFFYHLWGRGTVPSSRCILWSKISFFRMRTEPQF